MLFVVMVLIIKLLTKLKLIAGTFWIVYVLDSCNILVGMFRLLLPSYGHSCNHSHGHNRKKNKKKIKKR